jgi:hypothetical protein
LSIDPNRLRDLAAGAKARERADEERRQQEWSRGAPERARKKRVDEELAYGAILKLVFDRIEAAAAVGQTPLDSFLGDMPSPQESRAASAQTRLRPD